MIRSTKPLHETHGTPKGRAKASVREPPGLPRDCPRCDVAVSHYKAPVRAPFLTRVSAGHRATRMTWNAQVWTGGAVLACWDLDGLRVACILLSMA